MMTTSTIGPALKIGLQCLGMWPEVPYSTIYWQSFMSSMLITQYFQYVYIFDHLSISELSNLVDGLTVALDYSLTCIKLTILWMNRRIFYQILATMDNDWHECMNIDHHLYIMTVKANVSQFFSNAVLSFTATAGVFFFLSEYVIGFVFQTEDYNHTALKQLPIKIQFPFETQQSPIFEFLFATIFLHGMLHVCAVAILNGLIFSLVLHASGQIDIICQEFKNIGKNTFFLGSVPSFRMLVERHNRIISFYENIENLLSFIALMQVVWNTLVICCLGFVIVISIHSENGVFILVKTVFSYFAIMTEAFTICFAGEYLNLKGKLIANATYEMLWYNMPSSMGKMIMFIIMRSQKGLPITAGKMMNMSFETFTSIMKASVSYISVLNAMYLFQ